MWSKSEKHGKNSNFWKKILFFPEPSSRLIESSFDKRSELFLLIVQKWQNRSRNVRKQFLRMFFWSRILQFREHSRKKLPFSERFCLKVWKRRNFFKKTLFSKCSPGLFQRGNSATQPNFFAKSPGIVRSNSEKRGKEIFRKKVLFPSKRSSAFIESSFDKRSQLFFRRCEIDKIASRTSRKLSEKTPLVT